MKNLELSNINRKNLVHKLIKAQSEHTRIWQTIHRDKDKGIPDWESFENNMLFDIKMLNNKIDIISEILINNEWSK